MSDVSSATSEATRKAASDKSYVDAAGKPVEIDDVGAVSLVYKALADNSTYTIPVAALDPAVQRMLALFGASTLATNVASFNRNQAKGEERFASDADAVKARFERMEAGNWGLKPTAGRPTIDVDVLLEVMDGAGMLTGIDQTSFRDALNADSVLRSELRNHKDVAKGYDDAIRAKKLAAAPAAAPIASLLAKFATPAAS